MTFYQPVSYTQPKISVTYLIFAAELTHGLACSYYIYIVLILLLLLVHTAIKDLDLDVTVAGLDTCLEWSCTWVPVWTFHGLRIVRKKNPALQPLTRRIEVQLR